MAGPTQRKRRRRTANGARDGGFDSEGGTSEDDRDEGEKEERRWQLRLTRSKSNPADSKGKGKELAKEEELDDDDDEASTSGSEVDDYEIYDVKEENEVGPVAMAMAEVEKQEQRQEINGGGQILGQELLQQEKQVGKPQEEICGICFDEGGNERGTLDCCDHFFCFACIMEWSKVESRCPMCKQRFVTVTRPGISGVTRRPRSLRIPTRDQVCLFRFSLQYPNLISQYLLAFVSSVPLDKLKMRED
jgi:hypothetical protein